MKDHLNIHSVNHFHLIINEVDRQIEEKNRNKYLKTCFYRYKKRY